MNNKSEQSGEMHNENDGIMGNVNLYDYWLIAKRYWKLMIVIVVAGSLIGVIVSLVMTKTYKSRTTIMPLGGKSGAASALSSQLGGLSFLAGLSGGKSKAELKLMSILKSRTFAEDVVNKLNLKPLLFKASWDSEKGEWKAKEPSMAKSVKAFKGMVSSAYKKKEQLITISVVTTHNELSAKIANACVDVLQETINEKSFSSSKRNRMFIEKQLQQNKREFLLAGKAITGFYNNNQVSNVESDIDVPFDLEGLSTDAEDMLVVLETLQNKKNKIEERITSAYIENVPQQVYFSYLMLRKEILAKINAMLATQYEMSKIEEFREDLAFQVVDYAVSPEDRYKPNRRSIVMVSFFVSALLAAFVVFVIEYVAKIKREQVA